VFYVVDVMLVVSFVVWLLTVCYLNKKMVVDCLLCSRLCCYVYVMLFVIGCWIYVVVVLLCL